MIRKFGLLLVLLSLTSQPALSSAAAPTAGALSEEIYDGLRASRLIDSHVFSREAGYLGRIRNLALRDDGRIEALILEREQVGAIGDAVFRVLWERVSRPVRPGVVIADVADPHAPELGLFPDARPAGEDFLVSELLGEYARLQAGQGYGYVKDAVFDDDGKLLAVLVARDLNAGGGTFAFAWPGRTGRWSPDMSYYGLPFVTADQASEHGVRIAADRFTRDDT